MAGTANSGRRGHGTDLRVAKLKGYLLEAVIEDCEKNPDRKLYWAEKFKDKLMPQEIQGTGDNGELVIQVINYANNTNTTPVQTEAVPNTIPTSNGQGV